MQSEPKWLTDVYASRHKVDEQGSVIFYKEMLDWLWNVPTAADVDHVLANYDVSRSSLNNSVGFARYTNTWKSQCPSWGPLVLRIRDEMFNRGRTREEIVGKLRGLLGDDLELVKDDEEALQEPSTGDSPVYVDIDEAWWELLLNAPDSQLDASMFPLIRKWSNPPRAIEILEVVDWCIHSSLASGFVLKILQIQLETTMKQEGVTHEELVKLATWRNEQTT